MSSEPPSLPRGFWLSRPEHWVACGFGSGLSPIAPGSFGTLFAWISYEVLLSRLGAWTMASVWIIALLGGIWCIHRCGIAANEPDHSSIVWDEIVPFWGVLVLCPASFAWQLTAFVLFRCYDIVKPEPARYFDRYHKNGFGVMADDLVAAGYTLLTLALLKHLGF